MEIGTNMYILVLRGAIMARKRKLTGARHQLGPELWQELTALCEVLVGNPPQIRVIREAVRVFIRTQLKDRDVRERYEVALRVLRGGSPGDNVIALTKDK